MAIHTSKHTRMHGHARLGKCTHKHASVQTAAVMAIVTHTEFTMHGNTLIGFSEYTSSAKNAIGRHESDSLAVKNHAHALISADCQFRRVVVYVYDGKSIPSTARHHKQLFKKKGTKTLVYIVSDREYEDRTLLCHRENRCQLVKMIVCIETASSNSKKKKHWYKHISDIPMSTVLGFDSATQCNIITSDVKHMRTVVSTSCAMKQSVDHVTVPQLVKMPKGNLLLFKTVETVRDLLLGFIKDHHFEGFGLTQYPSVQCATEWLKAQPVSVSCCQQSLLHLLIDIWCGFEKLSRGNFIVLDALTLFVEKGTCFANETVIENSTTRVIPISHPIQTLRLTNSCCIVHHTYSSMKLLDSLIYLPKKYMHFLKGLHLCLTTGKMSITALETYTPMSTWITSFHRLWHLALGPRFMPTIGNISTYTDLIIPNTNNIQILMESSCAHVVQRGTHKTNSFVACPAATVYLTNISSHQLEMGLYDRIHNTLSS